MSEVKSDISFFSYRSEPLDLEIICPEGNIPIDVVHFPDKNLRKGILEFMRWDASTGCNFAFRGGNTASLTELKVYWVDDFTGIEYLTSLQSLDLSSGGVKKLNFNRNTSLKKLQLYSLQELEELKIENCTDIEILRIPGALLKELNVSKNTKLKELTCSACSLKKLDLSNNLQLEFLDCSSSSIEELKIKNCTKLRFLNCGNINRFDATPCRQ